LSEKQSKPLKDIRPYKFRENFHILPGDLDLHLMEMASGSGKENRLKKYINEIQETEKYDYIIIDTPPTPSVWMTSALIASDYYLVPVKPDPISYTGIDLLESIIENKRENLDLTIKCIGLVFTMVERLDSIVYKSAVSKIESGKWNKFKYKYYIPKRTNIAKWQLNKAFILDIGDGGVKLSLTNIVDELIQRIDK
jgi:chromosome partitioning protein